MGFIEISAKDDSNLTWVPMALAKCVCDNIDENIEATDLGSHRGIVVNSEQAKRPKS